MCRLGDMHDDKSHSGSDAGCKPLETWERIILQVKLENGCDNHTSQTAKEVAKNE